MNRCLVAVLLSLAVPLVALAQSRGGEPAEITEPSLPASPQEPTDFQGTAPAPAPAPSSPAPGSGTGGTPAPAAPSGYSGGDMIIVDTDPSVQGGAKVRRSPPAEHTVRPGETLWGLCDHYYGDPWAWPQLWALNRHVTNPHWIYPGDRLRMMGGADIAPSTPSPEAENLTLAAPPTAEDKPIVLRQMGFVDPGELKQSASIDGSSAERIMLSAGDEVYVKPEKEFQPELGKTYSVYRVRRTLRNHKGEKLGYLVEILGQTQVRRARPSSDKKIATTAVITASYNVIERKDRIGPLRRTLKQIPPRSAQKDLDGRILASLHDRRLLGSDELVVLNRGRSHGVAAGNRFLVVRRGDGYEQLLASRSRDNAAYPWVPVAEVVVLDLRDAVSVGLVTRATKEVREGDAVRLRRGY